MIKIILFVFIMLIASGLAGCGEQFMVGTLQNLADTSSDTGSDTDTDADTDTDSDTDADSDADTDADSDTEVDAGTEDSCWYLSYQQSNTATLHAIWGTSVYDLYAAGAVYEQFGMILKYRPVGDKWTTIQPDPSTGIELSSPLNAIWGFAGPNDGPSDNVLFAHDEGVLRYNGANGWESQLRSSTPLDPNPPSLKSVWGTSGEDIFAVGGYLPGGVVLESRVTHFDGNDWFDMKVDPSSAIAINMLRDVWGSSSTDVYAIARTGFILHYAGEQWATVHSSPGSNLFNSVWGRSSTDIFVVGSTIFQLQGIVMHFDGTQWQQMNLGGLATATGPGPEFGQVELLSVWGSGKSDDVWVVGHRGREGIMLHYDGVDWENVEGPFTFRLNDIWGDDEGNLYAVGREGILHCQM